MSSSAAQPIYRKHTQKIRQGDISFAEFVQLRAPGDLKGPGEDISDEQIPYFGSPKPFEVEFTGVDGAPRKRILFLWEGFVVVLHQNCEIDFASVDDSRLVVAPVVLEAIWPGRHWDLIRRGGVPGYLYLPPLSNEEATGLGLTTPVPEGAAVIAGACVVGRDVVRPGRIATLSQTGVRDLQDSISRFFAVRGYASTEDLPNIEGKRLIHLEETGQTVEGPARLIKMIFGDEGSERGDEEAAVTYFGVRKPKERAAAAATPPARTGKKE